MIDKTQERDMVLDDELLAKAKIAERRLQEAERQALLARAEYHTAVRRLHLGGGALREIALALGVSHQRVQQVVQGAGGTWWQRVWRTRKPARDAVCSFCGRPPSEVKKLIAGPDVYVCDGCVAKAEAVAAGSARAGVTLAEGAVRCWFCGKRRRGAVTGGGATVCPECLGTCREILEART